MTCAKFVNRVGVEFANKTVAILLTKLYGCFKNNGHIFAMNMQKRKKIRSNLLCKWNQRIIQF
jgi:hypothetical protein